MINKTKLTKRHNQNYKSSLRIYHYQPNCLDNTIFKSSIEASVSYRLIFDISNQTTILYFNIAPITASITDDYRQFYKIDLNKSKVMLESIITI